MNKKERILITGSTGFIGKELVKKLILNNKNVFLLCRKSSNTKCFDSFKKKLEIIKTNTNNKNIIKEIKKIKPNVIFHLAANQIKKHSSKNISNLYNANLLFGIYILESILELKETKFINTGSQWQHASGKDNYDPMNLYSATKEAFEKILTYYHSSKNVNAVNLIIHDTYGSKDNRKKLFNSLVKCLQNKNKLKVTEGKQLIDYVHINDIINGYLIAKDKILNKKAKFPQTFSLGSQKPIPVRKFIKIFEKISKKTMNIKFGGIPYRGNEQFKIWYEKQLPGWKPEISLIKGINLVLKEKKLL